MKGFIVKLFNALLVFSFAGASLSLEAASSNFNMDQTSLQKFSELEDDVNDTVPIAVLDQEVPSSQSENSELSTYTVEKLKKEIFSQEHPLLALHLIWKETVQISDSCPNQNCHPLYILNVVKQCNTQDYTTQFIRLCQLVDIPIRQAYIHGKESYDFYVDGQWILLDVPSQQIYLSLDNENPVSSEAVMEDPFLALRTKHDRQSNLDLQKSWEKMAYFEILTPAYAEVMQSETENMPLEDAHVGKSQASRLAHAQEASVKVANETSHFNYSSPIFSLESKDKVLPEQIWWQISSKTDFSLIPSNFEQVQSFEQEIVLPTMTETFLNPNQPYYFRVKTYQKGSWSQWSESFAFTVQKPEAVDIVEFDKLGVYKYQLSWEPSAGASEYLVFASNSIDFIPSVYFDRQINAIIDQDVVDETLNDNLVAVTSDTKLVIDGSFAYYRIIARGQEQLSIPSQIVHVYDEQIHQHRDVLQLVEMEGNHRIIKRTEFPTIYSQLKAASNFGLNFSTQDVLSEIQSSVAPHLKGLQSYVQNPHVPAEVWHGVVPYFLPENHPIKSKLDRMFSGARVTQDSESFRRAGFKRYRVRRNGLVASNHPHLQGYFIKAYIDADPSVREDWRKWIHRIDGARAIRQYVAANNYQKKFKIPEKWIYPLPNHPSPPGFFLRKNFILVAEDMHILSMEDNKKKYKKKINKTLLKALFNIILDVGLFDSVYAFNAPFCKDGKLTFIDTEFHHKWPIPFSKMKRYLSDDMSRYLDLLVARHGYHQPH